jgi:signal transduction histidine kinase
VAGPAQEILDDPRDVWPRLTQRLGGEPRALAAFVLCYAPLVWLGYQFKADSLQLTLIWPAVGFLMGVLYHAPVRRWPLIIVLQLASEYCVGLLVGEPSAPFGLVAFMLANSADAIVGALVARAPLWRTNMARVSQILQFLLATAAGASVSATLGAAIAVQFYGSDSYALQWQVWWVGNWLGSLAVAPCVIYWSLAFRRVHPSLRLRTHWEIPLFALALAGTTWWLYSEPPSGATSLLRTQAIPLAILLAAAFRLPPRWSSLLALGTVLLAATLGLAGSDALAGPDQHGSLLVLQAYLALMAAVTLIVAILVAAMKLALEQISTSEARYRNFIALSTEAVWRVEIDPPMPTGLPQPARVQWLRDHARVAESNGVFDDLSIACTEPDVAHDGRWASQRSWCALFEVHMDEAESLGFVLDARRLTAQISGRERNFMVSYRGVLVDGALQRIWCVAHDISEILELNSRLTRERERLKAYAHQLLNAEERARRTTAKDLHDGIGQTLTGMAMSLEVARMQAPQITTLLDDVRANLRQVQDHTRHMIADLSPPGLYELGLAPALQWLAVHFRSQEKLRVQLDCLLEEEAIGMELRVLVFKLVRELLRNVVKHSGVDSARVKVRGSFDHLAVEVEDTGRGFEWQMEMFGPRPGSFGLWSIGDRVADMGGQFSIDSAPGDGSRFKLDFPLSR